jgi:3-hydroxyacyl-CoA dehydrogenase
MPLLEIVRTQHTSAQVVVDLLDVGKRIKKTPIVVGNCTGFAVNRMFFPYTQSALLFVDYGMDVYKIDRACTKFGMPMGPFRSEVRYIIMFCFYENIYAPTSFSTFHMMVFELCQVDSL